MSNLDILLWCDNGNTCVGGYVSYKGSTKEGFKKYRATVYTD